MIELIEKRTRNSKTHHLGGRKYSWDGTIGSIHYEDNGWQEIDNIFEPALAPWDWQMLKAGYHIRVKEDFTAGQIIEFEKQGETVQFQPMALEWTNDLDQIQSISMPQSVIPVVTNPEVDLLPAVGVPSHQGTIRWNNAYGEGIDFQWRCTSSRLVKILEIENKLPVPEQYILDGGNPVLRFNLIFCPSKPVDIYVDGEKWDKKVKKQTFGIIEFHKNGEVLWGFMPLMYWDSEQNQEQSVATLEKRGNKLYISIRVPLSWLESAVYPVFIDASVEVSVTNGADDGGDDNQLSWNTSDSSITLDNIDWHCFFRFSSVTIPAGATIDAGCYLSLYTWFTTGTVRTKVSADDQATPSAPTSWAELDGITLTTAKVDWDDIPDADGFTNSSDIQSVIAELQADYDYSGGAAIQLLVIHDTGGGGRTSVRTYDESAAHAPLLHIEYTAAGGINYPISTSCGLTASVTIDRDVAWDRGMSPGLTVAVTIVKKRAKLIVTNTALTISATIAKRVAFIRSIVAGLTASVSIVKVWGIARATTANLTISTAITRRLAYIRTISAGLTTAVSLTRLIARTRTTTSNLVISVIITRSRGFNITTTANLTISVVIHYCVVLKELIRVPIDALDATRMSIARMVAKRLPLGRINPWRRRRTCE